jgi:ribosomal protein S18 acetylase RimI-like enzyme
MEISIVKGKIEYLNECRSALMSSELGDQYFKTSEKAEKTLLGGLKRDEIYVALDRDNNCIGFIWYILDAAFHKYPYIHIIAVKKEYRGKGIGKKLLSFLEETVLNSESKIFLVVADFNLKAKKLYEQIGYKEVGQIPDLYKEGVTEYLMMKCK